jgi:hypothetical protein
MDSLELRVERLERSCRRYRLGFLILLTLAGVGGVAAQPNALPDGQFAHLTAQSLTVQSLRIQSQIGGAFISTTCDKDNAAIKLASPGSSTLVAIAASKDDANISVSRSMPKGLSSAGMSADGQSGFVDLRTSDGKNKEIEPE